MPPPPSKFASLLEGIKDGGTLGFGDELGGGLQALLQGAANKLPQGALKGIGIENYKNADGSGADTVADTYTQGRDQNRAAYANAELAHPGVTMVGGLLGSAVLPLGGVAGKLGHVATGAAAGAAAGYGHSTATNTAGTLRDVLKGAGLGTGAGLVGKGLSSLLGGAASRDAEAALAAAQRAHMEKAANTLENNYRLAAREAEENFGPRVENPEAPVGSENLEHDAYVGQRTGTGPAMYQDVVPLKPPAPADLSAFESAVMRAKDTGRDGIASGVNAGRDVTDRSLNAHQQALNDLRRRYSLPQEEE